LKGWSTTTISGPRPAGRLEEGPTIASRFEKDLITMTHATLVAGTLLIGLPDRKRNARQQDGYPPYNLERIAAHDGEPERLRITVAVAGFSSEELELRLAESQLVLSGRRIPDTVERQFLHRGIATRAFQRTFPLAEGVEVSGARLENGLLVIDLVRPERRAEAKRVEIAVRA
jgi:HSP20 family molecular chaperone IbpA